MKMLSPLITYILPYKGRIFLAVVFNLLYAIFSVFSLTLIAPFLQVLFGQIEVAPVPEKWEWKVQTLIELFYYYLHYFIESYGPVSALIFIAVMMVLLSLLTNLFRYLAMFCLAYIRAHVVKTIRRSLYLKVLALPFSALSRYKKGDLMNRLGSDVQEIEWSIFSSFQSLFRDPILVVVFLIALCKISITLTLFAFVFIPIAGYLIAKLGKSLERNSKKSQQLLAQISSLFDETIGGLKVIKGYNAIHYAEQQFKQQSAKHFKVNKKIFIIQELAAPLTEFLSIITMLLVLLLGGKLLAMGNSAVTADIFVMYIVIFARTLPPIKQFVTTYYALQKGAPSMERVTEILNIEEIAKDGNKAISQFSTIEFKDVSFYYEENQWILKNVNLTIRRGEKVAIVGASGSGKSTLVDLLPRFYEVQKGEILIDGVPIQQYQLKQLRALFGWVSQDVMLFHDTISQNLILGNDSYTEADVQEALRKAHADHFIEQMEKGSHTVLGDRGLTLSGGQRQRLSIARALLQQSPCLILDEATSALDKASEEMVQAALESAMEEKTVITITHRFAQIEQADAIYFIENGEITEQGTHATLLAKEGRYAQYYQNQS